jgi:hypothetical protein
MYAVSIDEFMDRARNQVSGQPLLMEKVVGAPAGDSQERAVYVVNAGSDPEPLVFVEVIVSQR